MDTVFRCEEHFFTKACEKAGITFPITRDEAVEKAKDLMVRTDFDEYMPLKDIIADFYPESFENLMSWKCAYNAALMHRLKAKFGY